MTDNQQNPIEQLIDRISSTPLPTIMFIFGMIALALGLITIRTGDIEVTSRGSQSILAGIGTILVATSILLYLKQSKIWVWVLPFVLGALMFAIVYFLIQIPNGISRNVTPTMTQPMPQTETPTPPTPTPTFATSPMPTNIPTSEVTVSPSPSPTPCPGIVCITSPQDKAKVDETTFVVGIGKANSGENLYVLALDTTDTRYWLTSDVPDPNSLEWEVRANIGDSQTPSGRWFEICVISTDVNLDDYLGKQLAESGLPKNSAQNCIDVQRR